MDKIIAIVRWALAAGALTDLWFNASLFSPLRDRIQAVLASPTAPWWSRLLSCPYCFSVWMSLEVVALSYLPLGDDVVSILAVFRVVFLCDALLPPASQFNRFAREEQLP